MGRIGGTVAVGTFVVVALYLIVKNPQGDSAAGNAISGAYNTGVQSLQGR